MKKDKQSWNPQINPICFWELIHKVRNIQTALLGIRSLRIRWLRLTMRLMSSRSCCCCSTLRIGSGSRPQRRVQERSKKALSQVKWMIRTTIRRSSKSFRRPLRRIQTKHKTKLRLLRIGWIRMISKTSTSHEYKHLLLLLPHLRVTRSCSRILQISRCLRSI